MANTLKARMTATVIDHLGVEADCTVYALVDLTVSLSAIITTFYVWLDVLDNVTSGRVERAALCLMPVLPALKGSPGATSNASQTGLLTFTGPSSPRRDSVAVPALSDTLVVSKKIAISSGQVAAMIAFLQTGGMSLEPATSDWDAPLTFKDSFISFRQYNRQLEPATNTLS